MADNVTFQSGTLATAPDGSIIGTDNIGGIIYQRVKVVWGVDGVVNDTSATNPMPVVLATGTAVIGHVITDTGSTTVVTGTVVTSEVPAATSTTSNVVSANTNTTILAANSARLGATIANDSTAILYLKLGSASSATSYTVQMAGSTTGGISYYEVPFRYVGIITGTWATANGTARVDELTA